MGKIRNYNTRAPQAHNRDPKPSEPTQLKCHKCGSLEVASVGQFNNGRGTCSNVIVCRNCGTRRMILA